MKVLLTVFFNYNDVGYREFLPKDLTVNKEYFFEIMRHFCEAISQKRTKLWKTQTFIFHHDNALATISMIVWVFGQRRYINHASMDLTFAVLFLSPEMSTSIKGRRFATIEEIQKSKKEQLPILKSAFQKCFER